MVSCLNTHNPWKVGQLGGVGPDKEGPTFCCLVVCVGGVGMFWKHIWTGFGCLVFWMCVCCVYMRRRQHPPTCSEH